MLFDKLFPHHLQLLLAAVSFLFYVRRVVMMDDIYDLIIITIVTMEFCVIIIICFVECVVFLYFFQCSRVKDKTTVHCDISYSSTIYSRLTILNYQVRNMVH